MSSILKGFVENNVSNGVGKLFVPGRITDDKSKEKIRKIFIQINGILSEFKTKKLYGKVAFRSYQLYETLVYKFGASNRKQKFWRLTLQVFRELKRVNRRELYGLFSNLARKLEASNFEYKPSPQAASFLGSIILERIFRLDRIRMCCFHSVHQSMGYIQLRHWLTFNLMCIAIASDVAREALRHIRGLFAIYDILSPWLRTNSKKFPRRFSCIELSSIKQYDLLNDQKSSFCRSKHSLSDINEVKKVLCLNNSKNSSIQNALIPFE